jgi:hypothetical protein
VQENKVAVIGQLLRQFNPSHRHDDPIYTPRRQTEARTGRAMANAFRCHRLAAYRDRPAQAR